VARVQGIIRNQPATDDKDDQEDNHKKVLMFDELEQLPQNRLNSKTTARRASF